MTIDEKVKRFILSRPGIIVGRSANEVLKIATWYCCHNGPLDELKAALWRAGYAPTQVRKEWRLAMPEPDVNGPSRWTRKSHAGVRDRRDGQR